MSRWMAKTKHTQEAEPVGLQVLGPKSYKGKDVTPSIARICHNVGFQATGKVLKKYPKSYFEASALLERYANNIRSGYSSACSHDAVVKDVISRQLERLQPSVDFLAGMIIGAPGSGKTMLLKKLQTELNANSVCLLGNPKLKKDFAGVPDVFTVREMLCTAAVSKFDILLVDEFTLVESGEILLLQRKLASKIVVLFGDREQGSTRTLTNPAWLYFPVLFAKNKSHRFGLATASLCRQLGFNIEGSEEVKDNIKFSTYEGHSEETTVNLCFSVATLKDLEDSDIGALLVYTVQGKTFDTVTLFVHKRDAFEYNDSHQKLVGITRHRSLLVLRLDPEAENEFKYGQSEEAVETHCYGAELDPDEAE